MTVPSGLSVFPARSTSSAPGGDPLGAQLADDVEHAAVAVDRVGRVARGVVVLARLGKTVLLKGGEFLEDAAIDVKHQVFVVREEIAHRQTRSLIARIIVGMTTFRSPTIR